MIYMKRNVFVPKCFRVDTIEEFLKRAKKDPRCEPGLIILEGRLGLTDAAERILRMRTSKARRIVAEAAKVRSLTEARRIARKLKGIDTDLAHAGVVIAYLRAYRFSRSLEERFEALHNALKEAAWGYKRYGKRFLRYLKRVSSDLIGLALRYKELERALLIFEDVDVDEIRPYKAEALYLLGKNEEALREAERATLSEDKDIRSLGRLIKAKILYSLGRLEEAKSEAERVVRERSGPVEEAIELLARIELALGNYRNAIFRARELIRRINEYDKLKVAKALLLIGDVYRKKDVNESMRFYAEAIRMALRSEESLGVSEEVIMKAANRAAIVMALKDPDGAISFLKSARDYVLKSVRGKDVSVNVQRELAYSLFLLASFNAIRFRYREALEILSRLFYEASSLNKRTVYAINVLLKALSLYLSILKGVRGKEGLKRGMEKTRGIIKETLSALSELYPCFIDVESLHRFLLLVVEGCF